MHIVPRGISNVLSHKDYAYYISGQILSVLAFWMQNATSAWLVYSLTGSGVLLGMTSFCFLLPSLFLAPIGGIIADKFTKKHVLYCTQLASSLSSFLMAALILTDTIQIWNVMFHSFVLGVAMSIEGPNRNAYMLELVGKEHLQNAIGLNASVFNLGKMLGPALSGLLITGVDIGYIYFFTAINFLILCVFLFVIKVDGKPSKENMQKKQRLVDGFIYAYKENTLFYALLIIAITSIAATPAFVLLPIIAVEILGGESMLYGALSSSSGVGSFIAALLLASRTKLDGTIKLLSTGTILITISTLIQALSGNVYISILAFFTLGIGQVFQVALTNTLIQSITPEIYRGRVISLMYMMWLGIGVFGSSIAGFLNEALGIQGTLLTCFVLLCFVCFVMLPNLTKSASGKYTI